MLASRRTRSAIAKLAVRPLTGAVAAAIPFAGALLLGEHIRTELALLFAPLLGLTAFHYLRARQDVWRPAATGPAIEAWQEDSAPERTDDRRGQTHGTTGLPTREPLIERMVQDRAGTLGVIVFADYDRLCAFDPQLGERAVRQFASRILRMVGEHHLLAQVDRCHFALWFGPEIAPHLAETQLDAIAYALGSPLSDEEGGLIPETRVRHAAYRGAPETPQGLLVRLLAACAVKQTLPATIRVDDQLVERERDDYAMEQELRAALANGEFALHYQPQIDCSTGRLGGAEALLRWNSPERGMVSPGVFVPMLESAGLIEEVGLWTLNTAIRDCGSWSARKLGRLTVAVNVSSHQLTHAGLHRRIARMLESHGLPARQLEIELTESAAAADVGRAARLFDQIRASGVRIAIDDFGTGFSSLSALRALRFDKIKIDREFVTHVDSRRDSQAICQSVIALARGLGTRILAEGVERREEYLWLRQHGCTEFQGFYFSRPLAGGAFRNFAADTRHLAEAIEVTPRTLQQTIAKRLAR